ncbi:MAG: Na+/H+ antiporter subunit D, partial [Armatimonadota bacterium]|nr:Na+/H+ antiporter subunit D [Armatimonadota bacterium]
KVFVVQEGLKSGEVVATAASLAVSLLTLLSMLKIFGAVFWGPVLERKPIHWLHYAAVVGLAACAVIWGLAGAWLLDLVTMASQRLADPAFYARAVLGGW